MYVDGTVQRKVGCKVSETQFFTHCSLIVLLHVYMQAICVDILFFTITAYLE